MSRIYLAGGEASTLSNLLEEVGQRYVLYSYWVMYTKQMEDELIDRVIRGIDEGRSYILDSG